MKQSIYRKWSMVLALAAALSMLPALSHAGTEWVPVKGVALNTSLSLADNLSALKGKTVEVSLSSGSSMAGTVKSVGAASLHLSEIRGKEAYDALIPLDKITAVQVRFRTLERK